MAQRINNTDDTPKTKLTRENLRGALEIYQFLRPYQKQFWLGLILLFLSSVSFMVFPFISGRIVDIAQGKTNFDFNFLGKTISYTLTLAKIGKFLIILLVAQGILSYFRVTLFAKVSENGIADVRGALYTKIITLPISFFEKSRVGELISRTNSDVEKLYSTFSVTLAEFIRQIIILVSGITILCVTTWKLALVMLATFPVIVVGAIFFGRFIRKMSKERQTAIADTNVILDETLQAIAAVKAFTNESFESLRYGKMNRKAVDVSMKYASWRAIFSTFIVVVLFGTLFFVLWEGAVLLQSNQITAGELIMFFTYTAIIGGAIAGLGNFYTELVGAVGATERIREILHSPSEVKITDAAKPIQKRLYGEIEFKNVQFEYPTRADIKVLNNVSFRINAGQKIAIVGPSGAGKSTIIQLLLRFYNLSGGEILVDGKNIADANITEYRQHLSLVPQEVLLFGGTIRENILYGKPDATQAELNEAARQSNCLEFINSFPEGFETIVGERGIKLSGGQRQRIAIARAILRNPSILLLDEATSSLDAESEKVVQEALNNLMENRTSIIVAHRLATIRDVDQIYVLEHGRIVEQGTHEELSNIENGLYENLARLQFGS